ncbi:extracellular solute-binding protein [Microvirga arabica]|uniref:extracellular solute-binding protein n=1 Tax=Microvirga arabica TaxID=1128671 RepID=UPI00193A02F9|nr:extracellular solute-binding protein [Microvirga arabica]MBM1171028.1 extracellular solute-binding protein [Microvirga arabica]
MKPAQILLAGVFAAALASTAQAQTTLNVATAGDQNMVDYINDYLGPLFEKQNPGTKVRALGTGPGDAGSQKIFERLDAQAKSNAPAWDVDVAVVHEKITGKLVTDKLLANYRSGIQTANLATRDSSKAALGTPVDGYVMPMFHSQTAIAYNPDIVKNPPSTYDELVDWAKKNPKQFGYNGIKGGMSGVSFVMGWMYAYGPDAKKLQNGPFDAELTKSKAWNYAMANLKEFNKNVTFTPGNAGTLDMLNRGEIAMGPVWVDMFYSWKAEGRLNPSMKLKLVGPGMPGQPMYYVVPAKAAQSDLAKKFVALATSPEVQAEGIVKRFSWYPGIDAKHVQAKLDGATWQKLFTDVTPDDLATKGKSFPVGPYFDAILESYERQTATN